MKYHLNITLACLAVSSFLFSAGATACTSKGECDALELNEVFYRSLDNLNNQIAFLHTATKPDKKMQASEAISKLTTKRGQLLAGVLNNLQGSGLMWEEGREWTPDQRQTFVSNCIARCPALLEPKEEAK